MLAIVAKKSEENYLLVEIDHEGAIGMFLLFLLRRCAKLYKIKYTVRLYTFNSMNAY